MTDVDTVEVITTSPVEPHISVVIPVYSGLGYLEEQVRRVLSQETSRPYELILADNGSSDGSQAWAAELAGTDPRVRVVDAAARRGNAAARNLGARAARGTNLVFTDQDDLCEPGWLEGMVDRLGCAEVAGGSLTYFGGADDQAGRVGGLPRYPYDYLPFGICANLGVRADTFAALGGFDERLRAACDVDLCWRAQESGYRLEFAPGAAMRKRRRGSDWRAFRQHFGYALDDPVLFRLHRDHGMRRESKLLLRQWAWLLVNLPVAAVSASVRLRWARAAGMRLGRLWASLASASWYP